MRLATARPSSEQAICAGNESKRPVIYSYAESSKGLLCQTKNTKCNPITQGMFV
jgi:hypothetical protein